MEANKLTIIPPEGMEAYQEGNEIKFRPIKKKVCYEDVAKKLFYDKLTYYTTISGTLDTYHPTTSSYCCANNGTSNKQLRKLLAINKLMNVAKYLNGDWQPDWNNHKELKYYICISKYTGMYAAVYDNTSFVYFKTKELAKQAIEILGEETIKLALSTDW